jgi:hypothetical protein
MQSVPKEQQVLLPLLLLHTRAVGQQVVPVVPPRQVLPAGQQVVLLLHSCAVEQHVPLALAQDVPAGQQMVLSPRLHTWVVVQQVRLTHVWVLEQQLVPHVVVPLGHPPDLLGPACADAFLTPKYASAAPAIPPAISLNAWRRGIGLARTRVILSNS